MAEDTGPATTALDAYLRAHPGMKPEDRPGIVEFLRWQVGSLVTVTPETTPMRARWYRGWVFGVVRAARDQRLPTMM
ncbi:MAG: hypothetical protein ABSB35_28765 [Bryobacteraceae bacterium]|jgi:hypothetical protein